MTNKVPFNFDYNITFNALDVVNGFYPALTQDEKETLAYEVAKNYDYSITFEDLLPQIEIAAEENSIDLAGKEEPYTSNNIYVIDGGRE